ncbi:MAG: inositol monophosphatase, partial [Actinomycetota bacterium]|nr:inositol monophosphatase [Actinomycetota bacterium]
LLRERFGAEVEVVAKSTPTDLASEADLAAERAIRELLAGRRPGDELLGEEEGGSVAPLAPGRVRWVFDPLDGTINYLFGLPQWCVSVACEDADGALAGVVFDPMLDELFTATRDSGPFLNGEPVGAGPVRPPAESLVATGFAYDAQVRRLQATIVGAMLPEFRDVRRMGSAALDMAWLAAGRYDAYFERTVKPWDVAAGTLLCRRAGLEVRDLPARDGLPYGVMAGRPALLDALARFDP